MNQSSAVSFESDRRIHIGLAAGDIQKSVEFYRILFGQGPTKVRPQYAKFEVPEPPVNLSLNETDGPTGQNNSVAHFGVQVKSTGAVHEMTERFKSAGLESLVEEEVACCYAIQSKVWAADPDGNRWEVFVVLDAESDQLASNLAAEGEKACECSCDTVESPKAGLSCSGR